MGEVQRNRRKLANVFDGAVKGKASVHIGHHAQIHAVNAGLLDHIPNHAALTGRGKEYLIDKLFAGLLKERVQGAHHIGAGQAAHGRLEAASVACSFIGA